MDSVERYGVVAHDMTKTPWPFLDASFDHIFASHVIEHIPTHFYWRDGALRDVWDDVWAEIDRVLAPGGTIEILVPCPWHHAGYEHPQHYRRVGPGTFIFVAGGLPDHRAPTNLRVESWRIQRSSVSWRNPPLLQYRLKIRGIPLVEHIAARAPWLYRLLQRPGEVRAVLRKHGGSPS